MNRRAPVLRIECRKLCASPVARSAAWAVLIMATATSAGGYAAAVHAPETDMGRKAAAMISGVGWNGYVGLAALSFGVTLLLAAGIVAAWTVGREFTDSTIVGLFAIGVSRASVARAKLVACLGWGLALTLVQSGASVLAGIALGLDPAGARSRRGARFLADIDDQWILPPVQRASHRLGGHSLAWLSGRLRCDAGSSRGH